MSDNEHSTGESNTEHHNTEHTGTGTGGFTGKHARHATPETSRRATEEARQMHYEPGPQAVTEHADKTEAPDGKPSKPA